MHRQGLNYEQVGHITGHTTQVVEVYIKQEELENERYELLNEFQQFLRTGKTQNDPDRILKGIVVGGRLDVTGLKDLNFENDQCYPDGTVITKPVHLRPSSLQQQQIDKHSIIDISQIKYDGPPIPLPDFETWTNQCNPINTPPNTSENVPVIPPNYSTSKPTASPTKPPTSSRTVPQHIPTYSPTVRANPRSVPSTPPRSVSSTAPTRAFQAINAGKNAARLRNEQRRNSAVQRQQNVEAVLRRKMVEFKQREKAKMNQLIHNYKKEINKLQSRMIQLEKSKEAMECAYVLRVAELEQELEKWRNTENDGNNTFEIHLTSGNKKRIIINISSE